MSSGGISSISSLGVPPSIPPKNSPRTRPTTNNAIIRPIAPQLIDVSPFVSKITLCLYSAIFPAASSASMIIVLIPGLRITVDVNSPDCLVPTCVLFPLINTSAPASTVPTSSNELSYTVVSSLSRVINGATVSRVILCHWSTLFPARSLNWKYSVLTPSLRPVIWENVPSLLTFTISSLIVI